MTHLVQTSQCKDLFNDICASKLVRVANKNQLLAFTKHRGSRSTTWFIVHKVFRLVPLMYTMPINFNQWQLSFKCRSCRSISQWGRGASNTHCLRHSKRSSRPYRQWWSKYFLDSWSKTLQHLPRKETEPVVPGEFGIANFGIAIKKKKPR